MFENQYCSANVRLVRCSNAKLLVLVEPNVFAAFDNDRTYAECRSHASTHRRSDRPAGDGTDRGSRPGGRADLDRVAFDRAFTDRCTFGIYTADVVAFGRDDLG